MRPRHFLSIATFLTLFLFWGPGGIKAQDCNFQLVLTDTVMQDGWNGDDLTVTVNGVPTTYTLEEGSSRRIFFPVTDGGTVAFRYDRGPFSEEHSFQVFDNNDSLVYRMDNPSQGDLPALTTSCVACAAPPAATVRFERIRTTSATLVFGASAGSDRSYLIEYGTGGDFIEDTTIVPTVITTDATELMLTELPSDETFSFYISTICPDLRDTTARRGPFTLVTPKATDVGVTALMNPVSGCNLGAQDFTIGITNFGGAPQAFFNVGYSVNGEEVSISRPVDGIYTGVVGVDSTEFFTFDNPYNFDAFGPTTFQVYTVLEGDEDPSNDTFEITVINTPLITDFPYYENFQGSDGFWSGGRIGRNASSWEYGRVINPDLEFTSASDSAWVTNLDGNYSNSEISYLNSPCFDFSDFEDEDPLFSCLLYVDTEENFDFLYLESTVDEGESWQRVNSGPASRLWYNDLANQYWEGDGGFSSGRPAQVSTTLEGLGGEPEVRLRFVFESSRSGVQSGIIVDNVGIGPRFANDLVAVLSEAERPLGCGLLLEVPRLTVKNQGTAPSFRRTIAYAFDDGTLTSQVQTDTILPNRSVTYPFPQEMFAEPFDLAYTVEITVTDTMDTNPSNDTVTFSVVGYTEVPLIVSLEVEDRPEFYLVSSTPDQLSYTFSTPALGILEEGDELAIGLTTDSIAGIEIFATSPCLPNSIPVFSSDTTITEDTLVVAVDAFIGGAATFTVTVDLFAPQDAPPFEFFAVRRCTDGLDLDLDVLNNGGLANVIPRAGLAPYTFDFNGDVSAEPDREGLEMGNYTVIVTDAAGCRDTASFTISEPTTSVDNAAQLEGLSLFPNPTSGRVNLSFGLPEATRVTARLFSVTGREMSAYDFGTTREVNTDLELGALKPGIYLLRLQTDTGATTLRLLRR